MKHVICSFLYCVWLSAALDVYHEKSVKTFIQGITNNASFGYSVTYLPSEKRLIVSAPKANDRGDIFTCDIYKKSCNLVDTTEVYAPKHFHIWLGATVKAGSNFFMTCAPRYFEHNGGKEKILSRCYKYSNIGRYKGLHTLKEPEIKDSKKIKFEQRMLTFGWSMDIDRYDNTLIGGPAMYTGRAVQYKYSSKGQRTQKPVIILPNKIEVKTNFGYSVLHRTYKGVNELVISSTYGEHGLGMVLIFNNANAKITATIKGEQIGSMFGASLCAASVDGFDQSLLLVGAPTFANENMYNTGGVFIYKDDNTKKYFQVVEGPSNDGQFGYAIANLGDLNGDKKDEIAISAPYEDEGRGVVYIYSGAHLINLDQKVTWLQRVQKKEYRSFGMSLYAVPDFDQNGCKELAVGIPLSDTAVLFSCLAAITVEVKPLKPLGITDEIEGFSSFKFESCLAFQYPDLPKIIDASFSVTLDISNVQITLAQSKIKSNDSITYEMHVTSQKEPEYCEIVIISVPAHENYDPNPYYQISAELHNDSRTMTDFEPSRVTVSDRSRLKIDGSTWIVECAKDNKCVPKLTISFNVSMQNLEEYVVGSSENETLNILVQNTGDPAYYTCVRIYFHGIDSLSSWPSCCMRSSSDDREHLICNPKYLLKNNSEWNINGITLDTRSIKTIEEGGDDNFTVEVHLHEQCSNETPTKSLDKLVRLHWESEHVKVLGLIKNDGMINITRNEIEFSSKQIQHEYEIHNYGITTWQNVKAIITLEKEFFLEEIPPIYESSYECIPSNETETEYVIYCTIPTLMSKKKFVIVLPIHIASNIYDTLRKKKLQVTSHIKIVLNGDEKSDSVISILRFVEIDVPLWIILLASLIGLLIIIIIVFILYECGFLRRKKRNDLTNLRRSVQRQSMRRTTMIDTAKLIDPAEEAIFDQEVASTDVLNIKQKNDTNPQKHEYTLNNSEKQNKTEVVIEHTPNNSEKQNKTEVVIEKPDVCINNQSPVKEMTPSPSHSNKDNDDIKTDKEHCVKTTGRNGKQNDALANIIIGGLQKNLCPSPSHSNEDNVDTKTDTEHCVKTKARNGKQDPL